MNDPSRSTLGAPLKAGEEALAPTEVSPRRGSDRQHRRGGRHHAMLVRLDDTEFQHVSAAAQRCGLTPSGYTAEAALALATGSAPMALSARRDLLLTMVQTRRLLRRVIDALTAMKHLVEDASATKGIPEVIAELESAVVDLDGCAGPRL